MTNLREYSGARQVQHDQVDVLSRAIPALRLADEEYKGEESNLDDEDEWDTDEDEKD
jgi:hypothetical protein